jgi:hypothetical protein
MSRAAQECKGNYAEHVKIIAPYSVADMTKGWLDMHRNNSVNTHVWRKKSLTVYLNWT